MTKSFACFIKNDFHADEKEWRYVIFSGRGDKNIKIVPAEHGARMFYRVTFDNERIISLIDHIIIGPKHNNDTRIAAALDIHVYQKQQTMYNFKFSKGILREF